MRILVTGTAGFIGFHLAERLLTDGHEVVGLDGMTDYYDVNLKRARHKLLKCHSSFREEVFMLEDSNKLASICDEFKPNIVCHLAAQAGVRYSLENPRAYIDSNLVGTFNIMECSRALGVAHLLIASTSSVYGANEAMPFTENDRAAHPMTLYAATKRATELMTHSYSHLWDIPTTVFRFFSVYGPWGRPDMALFKFVQGILNDTPIDVYNNGVMERDFTYIDDLVEGISRLFGAVPVRDRPVSGDSLSPAAPWRVVNIGRGQPVSLMDFISEIEGSLGRKARFNFMPMQPGDVSRTFADAALLRTLTGYTPCTPTAVGVAAFCAWYKRYYGVD